MRLRGLILGGAIVFCASESPPPVRLALVIGNSAYTDADPLPNARSDARKISDDLKHLGFEVQPNTMDLKQEDLRAAVSSFGNKLKAAGPNVIGFVYYAGHAAQDANGVNYLIPIDSKARNPQQLRSNGTPVQPLLGVMESANNSVNILVLDACRDWFRHDRTPTDPRGLHDMGNHASMLIAFATRADDTADEGANLDSSPFSRRLIQALEKRPQEPIALLFDDVKSEVYSDTDTSQFPIYVNGLSVARWSIVPNASSTLGGNPRPPFVAITLSPFLQSLDKTSLIKFARGKESFVDTLLKRRDVLEAYKINTPERLANFISAIAYETGGFKFQDESFGYSVQALRSKFTKQFSTDAIALQYVGKPEKVADRLYANRLGNGSEETGDGWRFRGRGLFFITGKDNYSKYGKLVGINLLAAPELAGDLETSLVIAAAVWQKTGANAAAESGDIAHAAKLYRGEADNLDARLWWLNQAKLALAPRLNR